MAFGKLLFDRQVFQAITFINAKVATARLRFNRKIINNKCVEMFILRLHFKKAHKLKIIDKN